MTATETQTGTAVALASPQPMGALAPAGVFDTVEAFELAQRMVKPLVDSNMVPDTYKGNVGNALVALDISRRVGANVLMVMQNMHVIEGRPSWSSQYVIAALNSCGRFEPLRFEVRDLGEKSTEYEYWDGPKGQRQKKTGKMTYQDKGYTAWTVPAGVKIPLNIRTLAQAKEANLPVLEGPEVTFEMAVAEGWYTKSGSKWKTMPDLMGRYRCAKFFGNLYAPEILMGMHTDDEVRDMVDVTPAAPFVPAPAATDEQPRHVAGEVITDAPAGGKGGKGGRGGGKKAAAPAGDAGGQQMQQAQQDHQHQGDTGGAQTGMPFDMRADDALDASAVDAPASTAAPKLDAPAGAGSDDDYGFPE